MDMCSVETTKSRVQELYDRCNMVFCGYEGLGPTLDEIMWIRDLLGTMEPVDVGINGSSESDEDDEDNGLISGSKVEMITYIHIHQCDRFSIGVFCFPAGAQLPLHDHPEMVVLSKVLYGSVLNRAYDWIKQPAGERHGNSSGLARLVIDDEILDCSSPPSALFPTSGGNLHSFTALTPCAILDVLTPPYSDEEGRPSTYYTEDHIRGFEGFSVLRKTPVPEDLVVAGAPYLGPDVLFEDCSEIEDDESIDDGDDEDDELSIDDGSLGL